MCLAVIFIYWIHYCWLLNYLLHYLKCSNRPRIIFPLLSRETNLRRNWFRDFLHVGTSSMVHISMRFTVVIVIEVRWGPRHRTSSLQLFSYNLNIPDGRNMTHKLLELFSSAVHRFVANCEQCHLSRFTWTSCSQAIVRKF